MERSSDWSSRICCDALSSVDEYDGVIALSALRCAKAIKATKTNSKTMLRLKLILMME